VVIEEEQRRRLEAVVRSRTAPIRQVQWARIVLSAADGMSNAAIARALSIRVNTVRTWRGRFADHGMAGLGDLPRPGRPVLYGPDVHLWIVAAVTSELPEADSQWSHRLLAEQLADDGISPSQVGRMWAAISCIPWAGQVSILRSLPTSHRSSLTWREKRLTGSPVLVAP
jgi:transposase